MAYDAKVLEVMIASPSDVTDEREIVRGLVAEWNALNARERNVVMLPLGWDTHSSPELGGRPQQLINERILAHADILIGIFWTKLGTPTGKSMSGTAEEIEEHHKAGRPVLLYFSDVPVVAGSLDQGQFDALQSFKNWGYSQGLVHTYSTKDQFRDDLRRHLQLCLQQNEYIRSFTDVDLVSVFEAALNDTSSSKSKISDDAKRLLIQATAGTSNDVMVLRHLSGTGISAGGVNMTENDSARETARWQAAVSELFDLNLLKDVNGKGEIFEVTHKGYLEADQLRI